MTIRDASLLSNLITTNQNLGLNLNAVLEKFENKRKHKNILFAFGIDFIHEFFKLSNKYDIKYIDKFMNYLNNNNFFKNKLQKIANIGF